MNTKLLLTTTLLLSIPVFAAAQKPQVATTSQQAPMLSSESYVRNLTKLLGQLKTQTKISVMAPAQVPKTPHLKHIFVSVDPNSVTPNSYFINFESTPYCDGAHYCNIGSLKVSSTGQPQEYKNMQDQVITVSAQLSTTQTASYTPGHAMGDYWPPMLEWRDANYFYQLTWKTNSEATLIKIAQSIKTY